MILLRLALRSLIARRLTVGLTIFAVALSVALFLGVEKVRTGAKASFGDTISDTDLIVGARSGSVQLLLYSVFRIGNATNNVTWESYQEIAARPEVDWIVPISLGDSHRQFRVMGTTAEYFERYKYRGGRDLEFAEGRAFADLFDAVIGADVAATLGYAVNDPLVVAHGLASFADHDNQPFRVAGKAVCEQPGDSRDFLFNFGKRQIGGRIGGAQFGVGKAGSGRASGGPPGITVPAPAGQCTAALFHPDQRAVTRWTMELAVHMKAVAQLLIGKATDSGSLNECLV